MRLQDYLEDIEKVKDLKIGLVCNNSEYCNLIEEIDKKYELKENVRQEVELLNKELKKSYRGKFKFDFCLIEDININELKLKNEKIKEKLKLRWYNLNHELSRVKTKLEAKHILDD
jgi:lantibiotic modifying enzyme